MEEALSQELHDHCLDPNIPICLIRGVTDAIGFGKLLQYSDFQLIRIY